MTQQVKEPVAKPEDLSSFLGVHMIEEVSRLPPISNSSNCPCSLHPFTQTADGFLETLNKVSCHLIFDYFLWRLFLLIPWYVHFHPERIHVIYFKNLKPSLDYRAIDFWIIYWYIFLQSMCIFHGGSHEKYVDFTCSCFIVDHCHAACHFTGEYSRRDVSLFG